jgi:hypothetical protein
VRGKTGDNQEVHRSFENAHLRPRHEQKSDAGDLSDVNQKMLNFPAQQETQAVVRRRSGQATESPVPPLVRSPVARDLKFKVMPWHAHV